MFSFFQMLSYPRAYVCITYNKRQIPLSYVQTGATLLVNNSLHCWMLHVGSVCAPCCILLDVVACCCAKFKTCQTFSTVQTGATLLGDVASVCTQPYSRELFLSMSSYPCAYVCITYKETKGKFPDEHLEAFYGN